MFGDFSFIPTKLWLKIHYQTRQQFFFHVYFFFQFYFAHSYKISRSKWMIVFFSVQILMLQHLINIFNYFVCQYNSSEVQNKNLCCVFHSIWFGQSTTKKNDKNKLQNSERTREIYQNTRINCFFIHINWCPCVHYFWLFSSRMRRNPHKQKSW